MSKKLMLLVPTGIVAALLSVAPMIAQETRDPNAIDTPTMTRVETEDDGFNPGWLGLLGLVGLGGLMRRDRHDHTVADRPAHR